MRKEIDKLIAALFTIALLTAGVHAGHHDSLHVSPQNELTITEDDRAVNVTFIVNNTADRPVQNASLTVTNTSEELELRSKETVELEQLNASENRSVAIEVYVPGETP